MKKLLILLSVFLLSVVATNAQTIGKTKTEDYKADFEKKKDHECNLELEVAKKEAEL